MTATLRMNSFEMDERPTATATATLPVRAIRLRSLIAFVGKGSAFSQSRLTAEIDGRSRSRAEF